MNYDYYYTLVKQYKLQYPFIVDVASIVAVLFLAFVLYLLTSKVLVRFIGYYTRKTDNTWDDAIFEAGVFHRLAYMVPGAVLYSFAYLVPVIEVFIRRVSLAYIALIAILVIDAMLRAINTIYETFPISQQRPLKGFLQVISIISYFLGGIIIVALLMGQSPLYLLSGIGAMTAVLMLIFKNTILSFVAGLQISMHHLLRKGDWITMPQYNADGTVIDIALHTITVQNFDKTIVTIPTYKIIEDSVQNWRGMKESGGRRIKRSITIDLQSIRFLTAEDLERYRKIHFLQQYLEQKTREVDEDNLKQKYDLTDPINGRRLTNIGTFRAYVKAYLAHHPQINKELTFMVRQLQPTEKGLPLEIYVFSSDNEWVAYEGIQADIFDHLLAVVAEFGLQLFQEPTGADFRAMRQDIQGTS
jgi:miniconductance mechanosensitive channel